MAHYKTKATRKPIIERDVKLAIKACLDSCKPWVHYDMPVPYGYGKRPLDFNGCCCGEAFFIEAKAPGEQPTPQQRDTLLKALAAGATCFIISETATVAVLDRWLQRTRNLFS